MANQWTNKVNIQVLTDYMERGAQAPQIRTLAGTAPTSLCIVPVGGSSLFFRAEGKLRKLSKRQLVYFYWNGTAPTFAQCTCKNAGCVNPEHQRIMN